LFSITKPINILESNPSKKIGLPSFDGLFKVVAKYSDKLLISFVA